MGTIQGRLGRHHLHVSFRVGASFSPNLLAEDSRIAAPVPDIGDLHLAQVVERPIRSFIRRGRTRLRFGEVAEELNALAGEVIVLAGHAGSTDAPSDGQRKIETAVRHAVAFTLPGVYAGMNGTNPPMPGVSGGKLKSILL